MIKTLLLAMLATTTLFTLAVPAHAGDAPQRRVSYADLDLGSAAGRATLDGRIKRAVRDVCPAEDHALSALRASADCREDAMAGANTQIAALATTVRLASR